MRLSLFIIGILLLCCVRPCLAQYSLTEYAIGGGGGQATGGGWILNATVGEAAAGMASGGGYTLIAGFWGTEAIPAPELSIALVGTNVVLSWPSAAAGFVLQQTPTLTPASWTAVTMSPTNNGTVWSVSLPIGSVSMLFRLAK